MKHIGPIFIIGASLLVGLQATAQEGGDQGHHQSGIVGHVNGGALSGTPTGEGGRVIPDRVRFYDEEGELVTEVETVATEEALWHFEVYLKPATYTVSAYFGTPPEDGGILFTYPVKVTVGKKEFVEVALSFVPAMPRVPFIY